jgi:HEAT repeat protein
VEGLGGSTDSRARSLVLPMTGDESWVVRDSAYRALAAWRGDREVRAALKKGAEDPSWFVRETVREIQTGGPDG